MTIRTTIAAVALVAAGTTAPVLADDGDVRHAEILVEQARKFGKSDVRGEAAGDIDAKREQRRNATQNLNESEKRWEQILKNAAYGN